MRLSTSDGCIITVPPRAAVFFKTIHDCEDNVKSSDSIPVQYTAQEIHLLLSAIDKYITISLIERYFYSYTPISEYWYTNCWPRVLQQTDAFSVSSMGDYFGATRFADSLRLALSSGYARQSAMNVDGMRLIQMLNDRLNVRDGVRIVLFLCDTNILARPVCLRVYTGYRTLSAAPQGAPPMRVTSEQILLLTPLLNAVDRVACASCVGAYRRYFTTANEPLESSARECACCQATIE
jgi:hypothetical protein